MTINTVTTQSELGLQVKPWKEAGYKVGFVPTMGALHDGHMALVRDAKKTCERVIVSIFVNPTQFGEGEDFTTYPRDIRSDSEMLATAGVDLIYLPAVAEMYPGQTAASISAGKLGTILEGAFRPGHFDGVATVVERLLSHASPDVAFFGEKDYQQLQVIKHMVASQNIAVEIIGVPIVRNENGLALSSRNAYLSADELKIAPILNQTLVETAQGFAGGIYADELIETARHELTSAGFDPVDYVMIVDSKTLMPLLTFSPDIPARVLAAAKLGPARLIDNVAVINP